MAGPKITLYLDLVSPFSYLAYYITRHAPIFRDVEVTYVPIFLGDLLEKCNNMPPIKIKNKGRYLGKQALRLANQHNVPIASALAPNFPPNTVHVQRALALTAAKHPEQLPAALDALSQLFWVDSAQLKDSADIDNPEVFGPVLEEALGKDAAGKVIGESEGEESVKLLTANTDRAFASGGFGLPWFECENGEGKKDGFWGVDHLDQVLRFLGLLGEKHEEGQLVRKIGLRAEDIKSSL